MHLWHIILIGRAILQEYILLEHVKEITQWSFFENSVQKVSVSSSHGTTTLLVKVQKSFKVDSYA